MPRQELVGELAWQPCLADLSGYRIGVVLDALDTHGHAPDARRQDGERAARVAVLGLTDRAAVDEQHPAVLAHPRLMRVAEHEHGIALGGGQPFIQTRRLVLE